MKSYWLQLGDCEEGPFSSDQVTQFFEDRRINQHTPCKTDRLAEWRTVDEYLPTLKYGSELPMPSTAAVGPMTTTPPLPVSISSQRQAGTPVVITDVNVPFSSVLRMTFKTMLAGMIVGLCIVPIVLLLWFLFLAGIISFFTTHLSH
jgi:hypothetical protein